MSVIVEMSRSVDLDTIRLLIELSAVGILGTRGGFDSSIKSEVRERQGNKCYICGQAVKDPTKLEVHHKVPRSHQGPNSSENAVALCKACHEKADRQAQMGNYQLTSKL